ncbi:unnamed protein product [Cercospora beticola]|nr:unnamed protein product [Cercospora beticola]
MHSQTRCPAVSSLLLLLSPYPLVHAKGQQRTPLLAVPLPPSRSPGISLVPRQSSCFTSEKICADGCIPLTGMCCSQVSGTFCRLGTYCDGEGDEAGCCESGKLCDELGGGCGGDDYELCGDYCIPVVAVCCASGGGYCRAGETCVGDGTCSGGGSVSSGSSSSSGGSGSSGGGSSGGSSSSSTGCDPGEKECGSDYCIDTTASCCSPGKYCDAGQKCTNTGTCIDENEVSCGDGTNCDAGEQCTPSGGCIPVGAVDCGDGTFCRAGRTCSPNSDDCNLTSDPDEETEDDDTATTRTSDTDTTRTAQNAASTPTTATRATGASERTSTASDATQTDVEGGAARPLIAGMSFAQLFAGF